MKPRSAVTDAPTLGPCRQDHPDDERAGTVNPVILLDEVDKMSMDFRGDPSSALLEVLDPEQNSTFNDHYLEVDYDLSKVLFIATANVLHEIPAALRDRLEVIQLNSYLEIYKIEIAKRHIIPKVIERHGLGDFNVKFTDGALLKLVRGYTQEAGVRNLERVISSVLRKLATKIVTDVSSEKGGSRQKSGSKTSKNGELKDIKKTASYKKLKRRVYKVDEELVEEHLKAPKFRERPNELKDKVGVATGLAWTSVGGGTLPVEVTIMPGSEKLTLTGKLGDVMKESAMAALSYLRSNYEKYDLPENFTKGKEFQRPRS